MLTGMTAALEDSIFVKGAVCEYGSKSMRGFKAPFSAAVTERLEAAGCIVTGRTDTDEFGLERVSAQRPETVSGAVRAVASGEAQAALCCDVFGKLRRQAAEQSLCYIHPTYGTVSRYGLAAGAASMDQIGVLARNAADAFKLLGAIAGKDPRDGAMFPETSYAYTVLKAPLRAAIPDHVWAEARHEDKAALDEFSSKIACDHISLRYYSLYAPVQAILAFAEISANISRLDGVKYGFRAGDYQDLNEMYLKTRTEGFGPEAKLCALMGTMVLSTDKYEPYYDKAMRIRRLIRDELDFQTYDLLVLPARSDGSDPYRQWGLYAAAPLAGLPAVSFALAGGCLQLFAAPKGENALLTAMEVLGK